MADALAPLGRALLSRIADGEAPFPQQRYRHSRRVDSMQRSVRRARRFSGGGRLAWCAPLEVAAPWTTSCLPTSCAAGWA